MTPEREWCKWCGAMVDPGTVCPKSISCATCKAGPGQRCKRPSGHEAQELHKVRIETAEAMERAT